MGSFNSLLDSLLDYGIVFQWFDCNVFLVIVVKFDLNVGQTFSWLDSNGIGFNGSEVDCFDYILSLADKIVRVSSLECRASINIQVFQSKWSHFVGRHTFYVNSVESFFLFNLNSNKLINLSFWLPSISISIDTNWFCVGQIWWIEQSSVSSFQARIQIDFILLSNSENLFQLSFSLGIIWGKEIHVNWIPVEPCDVLNTFSIIKSVPVFTFLALINGQLNLTAFGVLVTKTVEVVEVWFTFCAVAIDILLTVVVLEFALFERIQEVQTLAVLAITFWSEWLTVSIFVLAFIQDDFVSLTAFQTFTWLVIIFNTVWITGCTQSVFQNVSSKTVKTFLVIIFQAILDSTEFIISKFEWIFTLFTVVKIML